MIHKNLRKHFGLFYLEHWFFYVRNSLIMEHNVWNIWRFAPSAVRLGHILVSRGMARVIMLQTEFLTKRTVSLSQEHYIDFWIFRYSNIIFSFIFWVWYTKVNYSRKTNVIPQNLPYQSEEPVYIWPGYVFKHIL